MTRFHLFFPSSENWFSWDTDHPSLDETLISGCATYEAFQRYLTGTDLYLLPRSRNELESVLWVITLVKVALVFSPELRRRRYAYDAIHNTIARARATLERGGYSRVSALSSITYIRLMLRAICYVQACHLVEKSISKVLNENDNATSLLDLHRPCMENVPADMGASPTRSIKIK